jgi:hypothetical protein
MDKAFIAKTAIKIAVGLATSALIGATIKEEKRVLEIVNKHFGEKIDIATE